METKQKQWTKTELQVYILLLCANADKDETDAELDMIRQKVSDTLFNEIYAEFKQDSEEQRLTKIDQDIHMHNFSNKELVDFRREMYKIFFSDCDFKMMEKRLDWTLDNILY
tara:strand:- start:536 stop:871 length:336 start_codon:yes stop_codon:yes gene_type:complete